MDSVKPSHAAFDLEAVRDLAQNLRGRLCTCSPDQLFCGSFNWAQIVTFDDGVAWVFRTPRRDLPGLQLPPELVADRLASEAATLRFLSRYSNIPVPTIYDFDNQSVNTVGVPYILMSQASGLSLASILREKSGSKLHEIRRRVMEQLGTISFQLSRLRFSNIGSIFETNGDFHIRHSLAPGFYSHDRHLLSINRGPFSSEQSYYHALADTLIHHVQELDMGHHHLLAPVPNQAEYENFESYRQATDRWNDFMVVGDKLDSSENRLNYYAAEMVLDTTIIQNLIPPSHLDSHTSGFPLCHFDLSTNNIFIDENYSITCIVDWESSSTVPITQLLAAPGLPHPRDPPSTADKDAFRAGFERADATGLINHGLWTWAERVWHFIRWTSMESLCDYDHFDFLCDGSPLQLIQRMRQDKSMKTIEASISSNDLEPGEIERKESEYFSVVTNGSARYEAARKLTGKDLISVIRADFWSSAAAV